MISATDEKCLVCDDPMRFFKTELTVCTGFSERPVFELFELFLGVSLTVDVIDSAGVCQECFVKFNELDEHQQKIRGIQQNLLELFTKTQAGVMTIKFISKPIEKKLPEIVDKPQIENFVSIKQEPAENLDDSDDAEDTTFESNYGEFYNDSSEAEETIVRKEEIKEIKKEIKPSQRQQKLQTKATAKPSTPKQRQPRGRKIKDDPELSSIMSVTLLKNGGTGVTSLTCDQCFVEFESFRALNIHKKSHLFKSDCTCDLCGEVFPEKKLLRKHIDIVHLDKKDYVCTVCGKAFSQWQSLRAHRAVHIEERNHVCTICGSRFKTRNTLNSHKKIHGDRQVFTCELCGMSTFQKNQLKKHYDAIHLGKKDHNCNICGKSFSRSTSLYQHMLIHKGEKKFVCTVCDFRTLTRSKLLLHIKTHSKY